MKTICDNNIGRLNRGNDNIGIANTGNANIGILNKTSGALGLFNSKPRTVFICDKDTGLDWDGFKKIYGDIYDMIELYIEKYPHTWWYQMTDNEKTRVMELPNFDYDVVTKL